MSQIQGKDETVNCAVRLATFTNSEAFDTKFYGLVQGKGMMYGPRLTDEIEKVQIATLTEWGFDGESTIRKLQTAARDYPNDVEVRAAIMSICNSVETSADRMMQRLAKDNNIALPDKAEGGEHGHSHNGVPCHGHGGHGGGAHGHQHNPQMMMMAQMAQQSLTQQQRDTMQQIQAKLMSRQQLTPQEQQQMKDIQQALMTYMVTMGPILQQQMQAQAQAAAAAQGKQ